MQNDLRFSEIFEKLETVEPAASSRRLPGISESWKQIAPDQWECQVTQRKLSRLGFRAYRERAKCGGLGFLIQIYTR
jgi:hypothetical protein